MPASARLALLALVFSTVCGTSRSRLDEAVFYQGPDFSLKVVRYYENLPLSFTGETAVVECQSQSTLAEPAGSSNDAGWVVLANVPALGTHSASEVVPRVQSQFFAVGEHILVWTAITFNVSWQGCRGFATWDPTTLSAERIDPVPKPDYCKPKGEADCRYYDFQGDRKPVYANPHVGADGAVEFEATSQSFKGGGPLRVSSSDFGKTWRVAEGRPYATPPSALR